MERKVIQSKAGWLYLGIGGRIFSFHLGIGRFEITFLKKRKVKR